MDQQQGHRNLDDSYLLQSSTQNQTRNDSPLTSSGQLSGVPGMGMQGGNTMKAGENQQQQQYPVQQLHQLQQQHVFPAGGSNVLVKNEPNDYGFGGALPPSQQLPHRPSNTNVGYQFQLLYQQQPQQYQYDYNTSQQANLTSSFASRGVNPQYSQTYASQPQLMTSQIRQPVGYQPMGSTTGGISGMPSAHTPSNQETSMGQSTISNPGKRKRSRKSDHAPEGDDGDNELKQLAFSATDTSLAELASRIKLLENDETKDLGSPSGPTETHGFKETKERQRQVFGMVWLLNSCEASPTAVVPRNRIYARYVHICAENNLAPLSPASFGKLVRILFPNLTTRRLGMRGQSKYHYCGIKLNGDQQFQQSSKQGANISTSGNLAGSSSSQQGVQSPISSTNSSISYDESPRSISRSNTPSYTPINSPSIGASQLISDQIPSVSHLKYIPNLSSAINNNLLNPYEPIQLPSIYPYIPRDTDYDIADTLFSLYKVHVNCLFESLRFMQLKKLFACFGNFNSILTAPVIKLYTNDKVIEWIKICDVLMYKRMIRMLAKLQSQYAIPPEVLMRLKQISSGYVKTMSNNLFSSKMSKNLVMVKLKLAKNFVNLLNRLIKIIETGRASARILGDESEKQSMLQDWSKLDMEEIVNREIPCSDENIELLTQVLKDDVARLLDKNSNDGSDPNMDIMTKASGFISELPGKFPSTNPRLFILLTSNLLTTCLREISLSGGQGFGAWWIVRCWVDELLAWNFELGGFLQDDFNNEGELEITEKSTDMDTSRTMPQNVVQEEEHQSTFESSNAEGNHDRANTSLGTVDLLDISYGHEQSNTTGGNFASAVAAATNDIILNYENSVDNILG